MELFNYGDGIFAFDAHYLRPGVAAIHLVVDRGRVALVDTATSEALPHTLSALAALGLGADAVDYVILSHIHLDHAGGAAAMMRAFPQARLVVHPRGVRHMADPSRLLAGATAVYGADYIQRVYPDIFPVDPARIIAAEDGIDLFVGERRLRCFDAPGHANHHICVFDETGSGLFTGDVFGLSYREMDAEGRPFVFPTTTPTQFDPDAMRATVRRMMALEPSAFFLTHFGRVGDCPRIAADLLRRLDALVAMAKGATEAGEARHQRLKESMSAFLLAEAAAHGSVPGREESLALWEIDLELNTQGLTDWLDRLSR